MYTQYSFIYSSWLNCCMKIWIDSVHRLWNICHRISPWIDCNSILKLFLSAAFFLTIFFNLPPLFSPLCPLFFIWFLLSPAFSPTVKYIKEMSAFFKSPGSPGASLPWDSPPSTPQRGTEPSPAEVKDPRSVPLKMCQVSRKQCPPDTENRYYTCSAFCLMSCLRK